MSDTKKATPLRFGITRVEVSGFKSLAGPTTIDIRPLTLLAGANSSGKSSLFQPVLLLKQTLESTYDPGPLLLSGPNVQFTRAEEFLTRDNRRQATSFEVGISLTEGPKFKGVFGRTRPHKPLKVISSEYEDAEKKRMQFSGSDAQKEWVSHLPNNYLSFMEILQKHFKEDPDSSLHKLPSGHTAAFAWKTRRNRCFLEPGVGLQIDGVIQESDFSELPLRLPIVREISKSLREIIHLPGLRGNPERSYPIGAVGETFPGNFQAYFASVIASWQDNKDDRLLGLCSDLKKIGLAKRVRAKAISDTQVRLQVTRSVPQGAKQLPELVNIADVGLGVSQTLPVLVALRVASPEQLVYLEQPEIHLHPKAQTELGRVIAEAVKRGVRVVIETHSSLILLAIQTCVAEGDLKPQDVILHWFEMLESGRTRVSTAELDDSGAFGTWPEDFDDVTLKAEDRFLSAAEKKLPVRRINPPNV